ncbi:MAG: hypothetical protein K2L24_01365 [Opitutales bacterium]|nr:hypothetical protein [Opitutales bacterium]
MKNHITKLISALLIGGSISSAIASPQGPVQPEPQENSILGTMSVPHAPYDRLREPLENLYGSDELGGALVDKFIDLANDNCRRIEGDVRPEEIEQFGLPARGAINPELVTTWFIYQLASIPAKERNLYFAERIEELNDSDSWAEERIVTLKQIQEKVETKNIDWLQVERLRQLHLLPNGFEEEEEEEEEAYLTGELD